MKIYEIKYIEKNQTYNIKSDIIKANIRELKGGDNISDTIKKNILALNELGRGYGSAVYDAPLVIKKEFNEHGYNIEKKAILAFNTIDSKPFRVPKIYSFDDSNWALFLEKINMDLYKEYKEYLKTSSSILSDIESFIDRIFTFFSFIRSDQIKEKLNISKNSIRQRISNLELSIKIQNIIGSRMAQQARDFPDVVNKLKEIESTQFRYYDCLLIMDLSLDLFYNHNETNENNKFYLHDLNACQFGPQEYDIAYFLSNFHFWIKKTISEDEYKNIKSDIIRKIQSSLIPPNNINWNILRGGLISASILKGNWVLANILIKSPNLIKDLFDN